MPWNPSPKVADCREIARKWGCQQVIIIGIDRTTDSIPMASYGETRRLCDQAGSYLDTAYRAIYARMEKEDE